MNYYNSVDMQRLMVADEARTQTFRKSIESTVKEGMVVLDIGAGSGILSLFAAQCGASRVFAVERAPGAAALARRMAADNGFSGVIHVVEGDAEAVWLPQKADVLVSEWLGVYGVDENMLAPVLVARDRWLKPGGAMIPGSVTAWLAPVEHPAGREAMALRANPYGLNLEALAPHHPDEAVWLHEGLAAQDLRAEPQKLWVTECATMPAAEARTPYAADLVFRLTGPANGLAAWFEAEMPGTGPLSNGPGRPLTHWGTLLFPIANAAGCAAGDELRAGFHNVPAGALGSHHIWASQIGAGPLEVHDTRRLPQAGWGPPWRAYQGPGAELTKEGAHA